MARTNPLAISNIQNPTETAQLAAIQSDPDAIEYIDDPSKRVQLQSVNQKPTSIQFIRNPSEETQIMVMNKTPENFYMIKNPTEHVQLMAIKYNLDNIWKISNHSKRMITAIKKYFNQLPEHYQLRKIQQHPKFIQYVDNPSEKMQLAAIKQDPHNIQFIDNPTEYVQITAVKVEPSLIKYAIKNLTPKAQLEAVEQDPDLIYNTKLFEPVQLALVKNNPNLIFSISYPAIATKEYVKKYLSQLTDEQLKNMIMYQPQFIQFIDNPNEEIQSIAIKKIIDLLNKYQYHNQTEDFYKLLRPIKDPILRQEIIKTVRNAIQILQNPTKEEQLLALQYHFKYLINHEGLTIPDKTLLSHAIELFDIEDDVVKFIQEKYLTDNDKIALVKKNPELIFKLKNPNEQLIELAIQLGTDKKLTRLHMLNITEEELKNNIELYKDTVHYYIKSIPENRQYITQYQKEYKELIDYIKTLPANDQQIPIIKKIADEKKKSIETFQNYLDQISEQILYNKTQLMKLLRIQKFINK